MNRRKRFNDPVADRLAKHVEQLEREEFGGRVPIKLEGLAQLVAAELRKTLQRENVNPNAIHTAQMVMIDLCHKLACAVLHMERKRSGGMDWYSGFGAVSPWAASKSSGGNGKH